MFRCKDCKIEYDKKPDYCDCGNNSFEEIHPLTGQTNQNGTPPIEEQPKSFFDQYPSIQNFFKSLDVLSTSIFVICLVLSVLSWLFIGKEPPNSQKSKKAPKQTQQIKSNKKIPDLESFWDNSAPKAPPVTEEPESSPFTLPEPQENIQTPPETREYMPPSEPRPTAQPKRTAAPPTAKKTSRTTDSSVAISSYKASLRQALFSHLAVASIQGSGKCEIEFSIDRSGRLLNRRFSKLSDNKSLNDAVYNMLMSVPQYSAPPAGYRGEAIRLSFLFDNGYYEVSY